MRAIVCCACVISVYLVHLCLFELRPFDCDLVDLRRVELKPYDYDSLIGVSSSPDCLIIADCLLIAE